MKVQKCWWTIRYQLSSSRWLASYLKCNAKDIFPESYHQRLFLLRTKDGKGLWISNKRGLMTWTLLKLSFSCGKSSIKYVEVGRRHQEVHEVPSSSCQPCEPTFSASIIAVLMQLLIHKKIIHAWNEFLNKRLEFQNLPSIC
jgi:hypothetical protein